MWIAGFALSGASAVAAPGEHLLPAREAASSLVPEDADSNKQKLEKRLQHLLDESSQLEALTIARGRSYVRRARAGLLPASEGFDAFAQHVAQLERLRRDIAYGLERQDEIVRERLATSHSLAQLERLEPARKAQLTRARNAVLAAEERDDAFRRAFQTSWAPPKPSSTVYGALSSAPRSKSSASSTPSKPGELQQHRGKLPFPVAGRTQMETIASSSGKGKAIAIRCRTGAEVNAVFKGRVAFADTYPQLGNTVIIDHGSQFYSVSANLQMISARVGDELESGDPLGTAGYYEGQSRVVFEIRQGDTVLNTPKWFGL